MENIFSEVRALPLSDVALQLVREAIVDGRLAPGASINQAEIAKQLGISRAPLREALRGLEQEGLVENVPFRGTIVSPLTPQNLQELQSLRRVLETFAAEEALERCSDEDLATLVDILGAIETHAVEQDFEAFNEADIRLHSKIVDLSGHDMLRNVWMSYVQQIRRVMTLRNRVNRDLAPLVEMHKNLVGAFTDRDLDAIRACYEYHGMDLITALSDYFSSNNQ